MKVRLARPAVVIGIALGAVVVLGLAAVLIGSLARPSASRTATGPVDGVRTATFQLMDGATSVRLAAGALGDDLYRVSVPAGAGIRPEVDRDGGDVRLRLVPAPGGGSGIVNIVVNEKVGWALRTLGGAREIRIDMTGGSPSEIQLAGGASLIDLALPRHGDRRRPGPPGRGGRPVVHRQRLAGRRSGGGRTGAGGCGDRAGQRGLRPNQGVRRANR
jgi:hypothetical protein